MQRNIIRNLIQWKNSADRKPLVLTGVRQCGKTHILKTFAKSEFDNFCYINFEANQKYHEIFEYDFDVKRIISEIEILENIKITEQKTLLIFDEIQDCPKALTSLKYFCEDAKNLHVACAGSLLGIALKKADISFPVGKVNRMQMYPMSFDEFLLALKEEKLVKLFATWQAKRPIPDALMHTMQNYLFTYYLVGGMPEVVKNYVAHKDFDKTKQLQADILRDYADDFSKHAPVSEIEKIRMIWDSIPNQLAKENKKFVFSHVKEGKRAHQLEGALQWLKNAGLVHMLELTEHAEIPLSAYADATSFKVYLSDVGLLSYKLGLSAKNFFGADFTDGTNLQTIKGAITENFVLTELLNLQKMPYFWRSSNTAELDFLYQDNGEIFAIEVKSATNTQAKSYKLFCKKYNIKTGFKLSLKNMSVNIVENTQTHNLPLFLLWNLSHFGG